MEHDDLFEAFIDFGQYAGFIEHLSLIAMLIIVGYLLTQLPRQLPVDHILLHLLKLTMNKHKLILPNY